MLTLCTDLILQISDYLPDKRKICLTMSCKFFDGLKYKMIYRKKVNVKKIRNLRYFDNFESIILSDVVRFPKFVKYVEIKICRWKSNILFDYMPQTVTHLLYNSNHQILHPIPKTIAYLKFGRYYNQSIVNIIPLSVTHLVFDKCFNQPVKGNIPDSVTYLEFGDEFNQPIEDSIPPSVTDLKFGYFFNKSIKNNLPSSITHLQFDYFFDQPLIDIPTSIIEIIVRSSYRGIIDKQIESKVMRIDDSI